MQVCMCMHAFVRLHAHAYAHEIVHLCIYHSVLVKVRGQFLGVSSFLWASRIELMSLGFRGKNIYYEPSHQSHKDEKYFK